MYEAVRRVYEVGKQMRFYSYFGKGYELQSTTQWK